MIEEYPWPKNIRGFRLQAEVLGRAGAVRAIAFPLLAAQRRDRVDTTGTPCRERSCHGRDRDEKHDRA